MKNIYLLRRDNIGNTMRNGDMCIIFSGEEVRISRDQYYNFNVNKNFFYLTGIKNDKLILFIKKVDDKIKSTLFIEKREEEKIKWIGKTILKQEALEISSVDEIKYLDEFESFLNNMFLNEETPVVYFDFDRDSYDHDRLYSEKKAKKLRKMYPNLVIKNIYPVLAKLRTIKNDHEVEKIREAINITKLGIENILKNLKPNMKEYQIESYFDFAIKFNGATGNSFKSIIASGKGATILHYVENDQIIKDGDMVLFDLGAEKDLYKADISRTFPSNGKFTPRQKQLYNVVLEAQMKVIDFIKPGVTQKELNEIASENLYLGLKRIGKIETREELSKYYYHSIGHLLGLDTHDVGGREFVYEKGMVVTVEPGIYIEDENIGIRIEDNILVTENGHEVLSKDIIKTVDEIEGFMKQYN